MIEENITQKRICCVKNKIYGALKAIPLDLRHYTVYKLNITEGTLLAQPDEKEVYDVKYTHELWCLTPVCLKKVGTILIKGYENQNFTFTSPTTGKKIYSSVNKNINYKWV